MVGSGFRGRGLEDRRSLHIVYARHEVFEKLINTPGLMVHRYKKCRER